MNFWFYFDPGKAVTVDVFRISLFYKSADGWQVVKDQRPILKSQDLCVSVKE